jgi:transposase
MTMLLQHCARCTELDHILAQAFPESHELLFALACYQVCRGEPAAYCESWLEDTPLVFPPALSSQRISEILASLPDSQIHAFFDLWTAKRIEGEYLALDITSISSYSELIDDVEWGYNRDKEALPQVNVCLLTGEQSHLPVRMFLYNGSLNDVSTLTSTLSTLLQGLDHPSVRVVMDKGFTSSKNIDALLAWKTIQFIVPLPFTLKFAHAQCDAERATIVSAQTALQMGSDVLYGITRKRRWGDRELYTHIFYNEVKATLIRNRLYGYAASLRESALQDPADPSLQGEFQKYLIIHRSPRRDSLPTVKVRQDVLDAEVAHAGWMVLISNSVTDTAKALHLYRTKDVVEKSFFRIKNSLGIHRVRVHSQEVLEGKMLVAFLALVLNSYLHQKMHEAHLYRSMTMLDLIKTMEKQKTLVIKGVHIALPTTKKQKEIAHAFGLPSL